MSPCLPKPSCKISTRTCAHPDLFQHHSPQSPRARGFSSTGLHLSEEHLLPGFLFGFLWFQPCLRNRESKRGLKQYRQNRNQKLMWAECRLLERRHWLNHIMSFIQTWQKGLCALLPFSLLQKFKSILIKELLGNFNVQCVDTNNILPLSLSISEKQSNSKRGKVNPSRVNNHSHSLGALGEDQKK